MDTFNVWVSPKGRDCRVSVEGIKNADWLLHRLSHSFVFKTSESLDEDSRSSLCTFSVLYNFQMTQNSLERLLTAIPEVRLLRGAAET
ncbi:MAG: hypothetical protein GXY25_18625 [Pirellulaceae bacterium]|jgi:hypothetical protein|nr:hypothetical protein [Thermoguttaceae bacterium]MDI9444114.1 hypothetical protein [Planctomycetota bacterium]NLZ02536.1 hypothetical protein [Pirellulaceae bacterium]